MFLVSHVETTVRVEVGQGQLEMTDGLHLGCQINVDGVLHLLRVQAVSLDVLLHVVPLDKSPEITKVLRQKTLLRFEISFIIGCLHCKVNFPDYFDIFTFFPHLLQIDPTKFFFTF